MDLHEIGATIETMGTLMVGIAALRVHHRFLNEHKVDKKVFRVMKLEQVFGIVGMLMIVVGYTIDVLIS